MTAPDQPPGPDRLANYIADGDHEGAVTCLDRLAAADPDTRKRALRRARNVADADPSAFCGLVASVASFLTDDERSIRLTTAKLFVTLARSKPDAVVPVVQSLAARVADDREFYFVRARCVEAIGYVALDYPREGIDPEILADLRIGLSFDEPEVTAEVAKALSHVALGDPSRLRHHVSSLAGHLGAENDLVRYHLCTALATVGCRHPERLSSAIDALRARLSDENPYVQGRAVEALALFARSLSTGGSVSELDALDGESDEAPSFLTDRLRFARRSLSESGNGVAVPDGLGTVDSIRDGTAAITAEIAGSDADGVCPHCGLDLSADGPPMCPRCGVPR